MLRTFLSSSPLSKAPTTCVRGARLASTSSAVPQAPNPERTTQGRRRRPLFSKSLSQKPGASYPRVIGVNPILDAWDHGMENASLSQDPNRSLFDDASDTDVTFLNDPPPFPFLSGEEERDLKPRPLINRQNQHTYVLLRKRVVHQTGKGKISSMYYGVVVGNGAGIVGFGDAKSDDQATGIQKATANAFKNCDSLDLFEGRTIWTDMRIKFGSTELHLRPRPRGFGLMCNPYVHQVCKAAGIKDISAKVHGSRNPMAVIKATLMLLQSGGAPLGMGNGIGGKGRREEKKVGIKSLQTLERERGRAFTDGGSWI
ncbi:28S ribosomal protein S5, mitochondrial [Tulasnella sp. UAMH 9824]|nr:28S ribosomal protein S5, mitochondrial [Tulasnella sp. UAMH 9824]